MRPQRFFALAALALAAGLTGCAVAPSAPQVAPPTASTATSPRAEAAARDAAAAALARFESEQRTAATTAAAAGHWRKAALHWEAVAVLRPGDAQARAEVERALAQATQAAQARLPLARRARQRGDADAAHRLYLEVLALAPGQAEAAEALRALERERVARQHLGQLSSFTLTSRFTASALMQAEASRAPRGRGPQSNEIEHATLLADQGELDGAIELLTPLVTAPKANPAARSLLADLYLRRAKSLAETNRPGAIQALQRSLQVLPAQTEARQLLQQWQPERKPVRRAGP